jgi:putative membrane protein
MYSLFMGPFRSRTCPDQQDLLAYSIWFGAGLVTFYLAVGSPLDPLGENFLFSAHMIQHNILMYICPLFILLGLPKNLVDHFLCTRPLFEMALRFLTHPIIAGLLFTLVFSFWHVGVFYEAAIRDKVIHMAEHLSMFFVSLLMWWPIISPSERLPGIRYGPQMLYILALMLGQTPIFAILTFSKDVLYDTYFYAERIMDLTPIEDQKAGGVLMKIANMAVSVGVLGSIFYRWTKSQPADGKVA